jgi:glycosyltransferase involved in cell wall biosynthesis
VLFLLTAEYPFGVKETYLDGELPFLARQFETVLIWTGAADRSHARAVPANVTVLPPVSNAAQLPARLRLSLVAVALREAWAVVMRYRLRVGRSLIRVIQEFSNAGSRLALSMQAEMRSRNIDPGTVVAYSYWAMESAMGCAILKTLEPRIAAVTRAHGYDVYFERYRSRYLPLRRYLLQKLDAFYVVSGHGAAYTERKVGTRLTPTLQVRYLGAAGPAKPVAPSARGVDITLLTCAALLPLKRISLFIDALAEACSDLNDRRVHWQHFGGGPLETEIADHARRALGGRRNVSYDLAGHVPHQMIQDYLATQPVDLLVSASQWEGLPVSMMEAMAHSVPVVTTDVGGCTEIVKDGFNGFVVSRDPPPSELAYAIRRYMELTSDAKSRFRAAARTTWERQFNVDRNYADFAAELAGL